MSVPQACPKCGSKLPEDAPADLCPKCLVVAGYKSEASGRTGQPKSNPVATTVDRPSPGSGFQPPTPAELADKFPQLEIIELLGHGGMGAVYKARQTNLDRMVALKIIHPEATHDPAFAERFNREAKTLARLGHQHIVAVHDFGEIVFSEVEDQPSRPLYYFLMEYVDGANLRQLMRGSELTPEQALAIVPQICDALQYAHDEGVVHRDIKPENILLNKRGRVKIADFGLAKLATRSESDFTLTASRQVIGTLRYMAPEQMEGSHGVDHRADIYSLGVVFYEMLTGEAPMGHFDPPSKKVQVDVRLDEVVLRTLARQPERRYQHASEVKTDVESISSGQRSHAPQHTQRLPTKQAIPPGLGPRLLLVSGMLILSGLTIAAGIALLALAFVRETPGNQAFWGWMGGALGCILGGVGSLAGTWNSYRKIEGAPDLWDVPYWTILDRAILVYTAAGVVAMGFAWILSSHMPWYPARYSLTMIGLIVVCQGVLFTVIRGLLRKAAQQEAAAYEVSVLPEKLSDEEQQRAAELAEIAPDWFCYLIMGQFAAGWVVFGLLWNFGWPGLWVSIVAMAAITYYVVQLKLRYLPKLRSELEREARWSRSITVATSSVVFILGMLSAVGFQATLGDILSDSQLFGGPSDFWKMSEEEQHTVVESSNLDRLKDAEISPAGFEISFLTVELLQKGLWAPLLLFSAVASLIHTRRFRYTWKHWWAPSLSITFYLLGMLIVVHIAHLLMVGHTDGRLADREIRLAAQWDDVNAALNTWQEQSGYAEKGYRIYWLKKKEAEVGAMYGRHLLARSWFDGYQSSWPYIVVRPRPPLYLTIVSQKEPAQVYIRVQFPHPTKGSPEVGLWTEMVDDLENAILATANGSNALDSKSNEETESQQVDKSASGTGQEDINEDELGDRGENDRVGGVV